MIHYDEERAFFSRCMSDRYEIGTQGQLYASSSFKIGRSTSTPDQRNPTDHGEVTRENCVEHGRSSAVEPRCVGSSPTGRVNPRRDERPQVREQHRIHPRPGLSLSQALEREYPTSPCTTPALVYRKRN